SLFVIMTGENFATAAEEHVEVRILPLVANSPDNGDNFLSSLVKSKERIRTFAVTRVFITSSVLLHSIFVSTDTKRACSQRPHHFSSLEFRLWIQEEIH
ncbi:hypothetical protein PMAYCL1PPCAC_06380, partial [Pristionchus mayeri]